MQVGETVEALVNGGQWCDGQIIQIQRDGVIVCGASERIMSQARGAAPIGIFLPLSHIRAKHTAQTD